MTCALPISDELVLEVGQALRSAANTTDTTPICADVPSAQRTAALALSHQDPDEMDLMDTGAPEADAPLADWLALALDCADHAGAAEGRSRSARYRAIGLAYGFALVAQRRPHDYAELLEDAGIKAQARAPMIPIVKLVFGATYDKTRLTEYAAALDHALANMLDRKSTRLNSSH